MSLGNDTCCDFNDIRSVFLKPGVTVFEFQKAMREMAKERTTNRVNRVLKLLKLGNRYKLVRQQLLKMMNLDLEWRHISDNTDEICGGSGAHFCSCNIRSFGVRDERLGYDSDPNFGKENVFPASTQKIVRSWQNTLLPFLPMTLMFLGACLKAAWN